MKTPVRVGYLVLIAALAVGVVALKRRNGEREARLSAPSAERVASP